VTRSFVEIMSDKFSSHNWQTYKQIRSTVK